MSSNNLSVRSKSKSRDYPNTDLGKLIHIKNLIENKDYKESRKFLKEIKFNHALYLFFKYQINILENKLKIDPNELKEDTDFFKNYDDYLFYKEKNSTSFTNFFLKNFMPNKEQFDKKIEYFLKYKKKYTLPDKKLEIIMNYES